MDAWHDMKECGYARPLAGYKAIHMPRNTGAGVILSGISIALAFALIWYIWWLAIVSFAAIIIISIAHTFNYNRDFYIPAATVAEVEDARSKLLAQGN